LIEHLLPTPTLLRGHLGEEDGPGPALLEEDAVPSHHDVLRPGNLFHRCQDRQLDFDILQLGGGNRAEAMVVEGGLDGHGPDEVAKRGLGDEAPDAAPELPALLQGDEDAAVFLGGRGESPGQRHGFRGEIAGNGLSGQTEQGHFIRRRQLPRGSGGRWRRGCGRGIGGQGHGAVAHHPGEVADGDIAGIGVADHLPAFGAHDAGGAHGSEDGSFPAGGGVEIGDPPAHRLPDGLPHPRRIQGGNSLQNGDIHAPGLRIGGIVREIGTGHDKGLLAFQDATQGLAETLAQIRLLAADDHRHDLRLRKQHLDEGNLYFHGMLLLMDGGIPDAVRGCRQEVFHNPVVHSGDPQGGGETVAGVNANAVETGGGMVGPQNHHRVIAVAPGLVVTVGGDLSRIDVARMGQDEGQRPGHRHRLRVLEKSGNGGLEHSRRI